jgi:hypothetical protein
MLEAGEDALWAAKLLLDTVFENILRRPGAPPPLGAAAVPAPPCAFH